MYQGVLGKQVLSNFDDRYIWSEVLTNMTDLEEGKGKSEPRTWSKKSDVQRQSPEKVQVMRRMKD